MFREDYNCYLQRLNAMPTDIIDNLALDNFLLDCYRQEIKTYDTSIDTYKKACLIDQLKNADHEIPLDQILNNISSICKVIGLNTIEVNRIPDNWERPTPNWFEYNPESYMNSVETFTNITPDICTINASNIYLWVTILIVFAIIVIMLYRYNF